MSKHTKKRKIQYSSDEHGVAVPRSKFRVSNAAIQAEDERLSAILFGDSTNFLKSLMETTKEHGASPVAAPDSGIGSDNDPDGVRKEPAWMDIDDDEIVVGNALNIQGRKLPSGGVNDRKNNYSKLLKHKFTNLVGTPKWAELDRNEAHNSDSDDDILQTVGFIKNTSLKELQPQSIEAKKLKDLNHETGNEGIINSIEFHPTSSVALVAGNSGVATLFAVDGKRNAKLHSVAFEKFPILCAKLSNDGNEAFLGSRKPHMFVYDLLAAKSKRVILPHGLTQCKKFIMSQNSKLMAVAGKWGEVHIISPFSKERVALLKQDSEVGAVAFNSDGTSLYGHSNTGEVTIWDTKMNRVRHKWTDDGCIQGTSLTISQSQQFIAAGSAQGVVNVYNLEDVVRQKAPKPKKTILNLTTTITDLQFNCTSEVLALASSDIQNSVRLFHSQTCSVFNNFPNFQTKLGLISAVNFSPGSGYLAIGNKQSTVSLFRLKHFKSY